MEIGMMIWNKISLALWVLWKSSEKISWNESIFPFLVSFWICGINLQFKRWRILWIISWYETTTMKKLKTFSTNPKISCSTWNTTGICNMAQEKFNLEAKNPIRSLLKHICILVCISQSFVFEVELLQDQNCNCHSLQAKKDFLFTIFFFQIVMKMWRLFWLYSSTWLWLLDIKPAQQVLQQ